jgi:hypothetical protein
MTYQEKDNIREAIEWDGFQCIMLGTVSKAGIQRRMDGSLVSVSNPRQPDTKRLETFAITGQWLFKN